MKTIITNKTKELESNQWKLKFKDHEFLVKDLVEPVVGIVEWAKDYVGTALTASPPASLAWGGVCLLLPLILNPSHQTAARLQALEDISNIVSQCTMREALYRRRYESRNHNQSSQNDYHSSHVIYRNSLKAVYMEILNFQTECTLYLSTNGLVQFGRDFTKWDAWEEMLGSIKDLELVFQSIQEKWRDQMYQEEWEKQTLQHQESIKRLGAIEAEISRFRNLVLENHKTAERAKLLEWLATVDPSSNYNRARDSHSATTGDWLVQENNEFQAWKTSPNSLLWLHGKGMDMLLMFCRILKGGPSWHVKS